MELWQALLIGLLGTFGVNRTPWFFGFAGSTLGLGTPIVACSIIGIILGDVKLGVIVGASLEAIYLGQITPGGAMPSDKGFATFIGGSLAIASGGGVEAAIALAVPLGLLGVVLFQAFMTGNIYFAHLGERYAQKGDGKGVARANILAAFPTMIVYTLIYTLANYYGVGLVESMLGALPKVMMDTLSVSAKIIPAVGFAMLLKYTVINGREWLLAFFAMGFVLVANTGFNIVSLVIFAIGIAILFISPMILAPQAFTGSTFVGKSMTEEMEDGDYEE